MKQRPVAVGLFLCEEIVTENVTPNNTLVNCFTRRFVGGFPSEGLNFILFALLSDGQGEVRLSVLIQSLDNLEEVYPNEFSYRFQHPLQNVRFLLRIRDLSFPREGYFLAVLLAEGEPIAQRKFRIIHQETLP